MFNLCPHNVLIDYIRYSRQFHQEGNLEENFSITRKRNHTQAISSEECHMQTILRKKITCRQFLRKKSHTANFFRRKWNNHKFTYIFGYLTIFKLKLSGRCFAPKMWCLMIRFPPYGPIWFAWEYSVASSFNQVDIREGWRVMWTGDIRWSEIFWGKTFSKWEMTLKSREMTRKSKEGSNGLLGPQILSLVLVQLMEALQ